MVRKFVPVRSTIPDVYATLTVYRLRTGGDIVTPTRALFKGTDGVPRVVWALPPRYHVPSPALDRP